MCTHACSLLIKMEHITQSSCEDKSLHLCCFDYPHSVSGHLPPSCSFSMRRKLYQSSRHWARSPAGEQRQSRLAAIQTASSSLTLMTDISHTLLSVLFVEIHIISQWTPDNYLHDNRRMSVPVYCMSAEGPVWCLYWVFKSPSCFHFGPASVKDHH